jgi:hypothetical protein
MAGIYDGLEEIGFKPIAGGYLFQTSNRWLIGPSRRYVVDEAQKADIAACIRDTFRRIKPFAIAAAFVIPLMMLGAIFWFVTRGGTLDVSVTEASGATQNFSQMIGPEGASGSWPGADGSTIVFKVSGPPGASSVVTIMSVDASGKTSAPCVVPFSAAGASINAADSKHKTVRTIRLVGHRGPTPVAVMVFTTLLTFVLFAIYLGAIQTYRVRRLAPLLAGLPRSQERMTILEGVERYAANMSIKLLSVMGFSAIMLAVATVLNVAEAIEGNRSLANLPFIVSATTTAFVAAQVAYLTIIKIRQRRQTA